MSSRSKEFSRLDCITSQQHRPTLSCRNYILPLIPWQPTPSTVGNRLRCQQVISRGIRMHLHMYRLCTCTGVLCIRIQIHICRVTEHIRNIAHMCACIHVCVSLGCSKYRSNKSAFRGQRCTRSHQAMVAVLPTVRNSERRKYFINRRLTGYLFLSFYRSTSWSGVVYAIIKL